MRVLLVHPNLSRHPVPAAPSGLGWLAAALRARGANVRILDLTFVWNRTEAIPQAIAALEPDVVGVGIPHLDNDCAFHASSTLPQIRWVVERIRRCSGVPVVAGGSGASLFPEEILTYLGLQHGFVGGDVSRASALLEGLAAGGACTGIPGAVHWDGSRYRRDADPPAECAAVRPYAAAHDLISYRRHLWTGGAAVVPVELEVAGQVTPRGAQEISDEIGELEAIAGVRHVLLGGLSLGRDPHRDDELLSALAARGRSTCIEIEAIPSALTRERIDVLCAAGCTGVKLVLSSPADDPDSLIRAVERVAHRVATKLVVSVGGPTETSESLERTLAVLAALRPEPARIEFHPGVRLLAPPTTATLEIRGSVAGASYLWPRFGLSPEIGIEVLGRLRAAGAERPRWTIDVDGYAPWYRAAFAVERRVGRWPRWRNGTPWVGLPKRMRKLTAVKSTLPARADVTSSQPFVRPIGA